MAGRAVVNARGSGTGQGAATHVVFLLGRGALRLALLPDGRECVDRLVVRLRVAWRAGHSFPARCGRIGGSSDTVISRSCRFCKGKARCYLRQGHPARRARPYGVPFPNPHVHACEHICAQAIAWEIGTACVEPTNVLFCMRSRFRDDSGVPLLQESLQNLFSCFLIAFCFFFGAVSPLSGPPIRFACAARSICVVVTLISFVFMESLIIRELGFVFGANII